jgi:hypothetical protein
MKNVVAIFGYNNSRLYDVIKLQRLVRERLGADILLVKDGLTEADYKVTPHCINWTPDDPKLSDILNIYLNLHQLRLIGCLPFSDKGVIGAAHVAENFGIVGDAASTAHAMLDKFAFRDLEAAINFDDSLYKKPFFCTLRSALELRAFLKTSGCFFLKPKAEGNSRGCMVIETDSDIDRWLAENPTALDKGVIIEEIINASEFSFDSVGGAHWITQKFTTTGRFRAEYQQIVPAPFPEDLTLQLQQVFMPLLAAMGSRGGAFHHEFFLLTDRRVASVEPNRRPAGMWIWDLAAWAFRDFDPWAVWVDWCAGHFTNSITLKQTAFAGVRGVIARCDGTLKLLDEEGARSVLSDRFGPENVRFAVFKNSGDTVRAEPRDNSDFIAFVAIRRASYEELVRALAEAEIVVLDHMKMEDVCVGN